MAAIASIIGGSSVVDKSGNSVDVNTKCAGKIVGIYFSAHWYIQYVIQSFHKFLIYRYRLRCGPCRNFTPVLADFYKNHAKSKNFEVIFVSSDSDDESFNEYYAEMPWLALAYSCRDKKVY